MNREKELEVSVVFPVYNESENLENAVNRTFEELEKISSSSYEIIIAEDGSTDGSEKIAEALASKYRFVRHIHRDERLGRGQALNNAFKSSKGKILIYMDADLATDLKHLETLISYVRQSYDFATGSRMLKESKVERSWSRLLASKSYNFLVRFLLGSKVSDHQCGFKAFKREPLLKMIDEVEASHWFWDTEIIVRYSSKGLKIKEFPVKWKGKGGTKVKLAKDSFGMGTQALKLWWNLKVKEKIKRKT